MAEQILSEEERAEFDRLFAEKDSSKKEEVEDEAQVAEESENLLDSRESEINALMEKLLIFQEFFNNVDAIVHSDFDNKAWITMVQNMVRQAKGQLEGNKI